MGLISRSVVAEQIEHRAHIGNQMDAVLDVIEEVVGEAAERCAQIARVDQESITRAIYENNSPTADQIVGTLIDTFGLDEAAQALYRAFRERGQLLPGEAVQGLPEVEIGNVTSGTLVAGASDAPVADAPVADAPVADAPVADAPVADAPVADAPVADAPVDSVVAQ